MKADVTNLVEPITQAPIADQYRKERSFQIFLVSEVALILALIMEYFRGGLELVIGLAATIVVLAVFFLAFRNRKPNLATGLLVIFHTILASCLMWKFGGIRDEAMLAFPMILIFATVLGSTRLVSVVFLCIACLIFANGYVNEIGYYQNDTPVIDLSSAALINLILLVIFISTLIASKAINKLIAQLVEENKVVVNSKREIQKLVYQDALTNLPNRVLAREIFDKNIQKTVEDGKSTALLFIDLDDFKSINDSLGHQIGDKLLKLIARRIAGMVTPYGGVYRLGGDEFMVLLEEFSDDNDVIEMGNRICSLVNQVLKIDEYDLLVSCSIGATIAPRDTDNFDTALKYSDIALYQAKRLGRNQICLISQELIKHTEKEFYLLEEFRRAVKDNKLELYYQPKICLTTGRMTGGEALLRWWSDNYGGVSPDVFIPIAEKAGLINGIGDWVLEQAIEQCSVWHKMGFDDFTVAVNVSPIQFAMPNFAANIYTLLDKYKLDEKYLELEITENVLLEQSENLSKNIKMLSKSQVKLSIDDFGKGYSNLAYIKRLNIHAIKIDREFITDVDKDEDNLAIVKAIIDIANHLNIDAVAEGVETQEVVNLLSELSCNLGQGFLWSPAVNKDDFIRFAQTRAAKVQL
ncbi:putative bifunctional diguanylate cyclase/phosphodiesterase [Thalassotalea crassostreae]|uniref:putative bifunctional diguanylate cyclase/phosphodiesterase n=1 Tax=Thalassotalea crassostreae TaxID=1763536 RepID=UPI0008394AF0|nr:GGDEF domain-containing phosphodiesterase [Thalassotalea crassostreae]